MKKDNEEVLREILEQSLAGYWDWDIPSGDEYLSPTFKHMFGYEDHEIQNRADSWQKLIFQEDLPGVLDQFNRHVESKGKIPFYNEIRFHHKSGSTVWVICTGKVIEWDDADKPIRMVGCHIDITERKRSEEALALERTRLAGILEGTNVGSWEWNVQTGETVFNERWADIIGHTLEEISPTSIETWMGFAHPDDLKKSEDALNKHFLGEADYYECESRMKHKDGSWVWVLDRGKVTTWTKDGKPLLMMGTHQDITDRKEALRKITDSELKFRTLFETLPVGITIADADGYILESNKAAEEILGLSPEQQAQRKIDGVEWTIIRPDGSLMPGEEYASVRALKEKRPIYGVEMGVTRGVDDIVWIIVNAVPVHGLGVVISYVDVTMLKQVQAELVTARIKAEEASKAKSQFLANMSHEIRTPLNGVIGFTELLKNTRLSPVQEEYVDHANVAGRTLLGIINDILDFSKIEAGMMKLDVVKTDMIELFENSIDIVKYAGGEKKLELLLDIDPAMPRYAQVDPVRLKQILANLLGNAVKFTQKGEVELKVRYTGAEDGQGRFRIRIRDTGIGMTEEQQTKLFRAFSQADNSTTRKFGGTGLGLVISQMIATEMGSQIEIDSIPDMGTTCFFDLVAAVAHGNPVDTSARLSVKRCLVIDDNAPNRLILEHMLAYWGIACESCDNGFAALEIIETADPPFDVIICDYHMPYLDGLETIGMIREKLKLPPEKQPVMLLHSSSDDAELYKRCDEMGIFFRLTKPVKAGEMYRYLCDIHTMATEKPVSAAGQADAVNSDASAITVLIAEDISVNMILIKAMIKKAMPNARMIEASNGKEAVAWYQRERVDLILMDIQMPECDGIEATLQIRSLEKGTDRRVPIVALTAGALKEEKEKCLAAGMDDFLAKPIESEKLSAVLAKAAKAEAKQAEAVHFDRDKFLQRMDGDKNLYAELINQVMTSFPMTIDQLGQAIEGRDFAASRAIAHQLKGAALHMCFQAFADIANDLELHFHAGDDDPMAKEKFKALQDEWDRVLVRLKTDL